MHVLLCVLNEQKEEKEEEKSREIVMSNFLVVRATRSMFESNSTVIIHISKAHFKKPFLNDDIERMNINN